MPFSTSPAGTPMVTSWGNGWDLEAITNFQELVWKSLMKCRVADTDDSLREQTISSNPEQGLNNHVLHRMTQPCELVQTCSKYV